MTLPNYSFIQQGARIWLTAKHGGDPVTVKEIVSGQALVSFDDDGIPDRRYYPDQLQEHAPTKDEIDAATIREEKRNERIAKAPPGVAKFINAVRVPGEDDALDGPVWIIPGVLMQGQTAMCPGAPGSGKSFVILD